jgi:CheY-like chemotaxis protein
MPHRSSSPPGHHAAQLYEGPEFLQRAVATFFAEAPRGGSMVMVSRRDTYGAVCERLAPALDCDAAQAASRVLFVDVHAALQGFMEDGKLNLGRAEIGFSALLDTVNAHHGDGPIHVYGEMVDVLCSEGNHSSAIQLETLWNSRFGDRGISVLCGYAMAHFDRDEDGSCLRAVCREHTLVAPTETFVDLVDAAADRSRVDHLVSLEHRARQRALRKENPPTPRFASGTGVICLIDDEPSVRRSIVRLLTSVGLSVNAYASAEAFLAEIHQIPVGCIVADVQLTGMSGLELQQYLQGTGLPSVIISGSYDPQVEIDALRFGATEFLRKPFPAERLFDAIQRALS